MVGRRRRRQTGGQQEKQQKRHERVRVFLMFYFVSFLIFLLLLFLHCFIVVVHRFKLYIMHVCTVSVSPTETTTRQRHVENSAHKNKKHLK